MATIYTKTDASGKQIFSDCRVIELEGVWISNPTEEQIFSAGWQIYVPPVIPPQPVDEPDMTQMVAAVQKMLASSVEGLTDEKALEVAALYPTWRSLIGQQVAAGQRLWDDEKLWKVLQAHTVSEEWRPAEAVSLYVQVSIEEWPAWKQPVGATDAYPLGAKVTHNDKHWISNVDANTWEPGIYGWDEQA